ncbi:hypothetical protein EVG20_g9713 [Dentipellis fragilis]|uniref:Protein kinase domain-containing protein n=1 Tax=Dentipellis fragilis TaxID=205917 RepID=A0A4Y9XVY2_9AGAM|nr:hypothetical protein EVG20_g9713 [Dentipellis fragilis]
MGIRRKEALANGPWPGNAGRRHSATQAPGGDLMQTEGDDDRGTERGSVREGDRRRLLDAKGTARWRPAPLGKARLLFVSSCVSGILDLPVLLAGLSFEKKDGGMDEEAAGQGVSRTGQGQLVGVAGFKARSHPASAHKLLSSSSPHTQPPRPPHARPPLPEAIAEAQAAGVPAWHPRLILQVADESIEEEVRFVDEHGPGLYEVSFKVEKGARGTVRTPYGRISWIPNTKEEEVITALIPVFLLPVMDTEHPLTGELWILNAVPRYSQQANTLHPRVMLQPLCSPCNVFADWKSGRPYPRIGVTDKAAGAISRLRPAVSKTRTTCTGLASMRDNHYAQPYEKEHAAPRMHPRERVAGTEGGDGGSSEAALAVSCRCWKTLDCCARMTGGESARTQRRSGGGPAALEGAVAKTITIRIRLTTIYITPLAPPCRTARLFLRPPRYRIHVSCRTHRLADVVRAPASLAHLFVELENRPHSFASPFSDPPVQPSTPSSSKSKTDAFFSTSFSALPTPLPSSSKFELSPIDTSAKKPNPPPPLTRSRTADFFSGPSPRPTPHPSPLALTHSLPGANADAPASPAPPRSLTASFFSAPSESKPDPPPSLRSVSSIASIASSTFPSPTESSFSSHDPQDRKARLPPLARLFPSRYNSIARSEDSDHDFPSSPSPRVRDFVELEVDGGQPSGRSPRSAMIEVASPSNTAVFPSTPTAPENETHVHVAPSNVFRTGSIVRPALGDQCVGHEYELLQLIGHGAFSRVWKAQDKSKGKDNAGEGTLVAVKMVARSVGNGGKSRERDRMRASFVREVEILMTVASAQRLSSPAPHPSIPFIVASFTVPSHHVLVLPLIPGGELLSVINSDEQHARMTEDFVEADLG